MQIILPCRCEIQQKIAYPQMLFTFFYLNLGYEFNACVNIIYYIIDWKIQKQFYKIIT